MQPAQDRTRQVKIKKKEEAKKIEEKGTEVLAPMVNDRGQP